MLLKSIYFHQNLKLLFLFLFLFNYCSAQILTNDSITKMTVLPFNYELFDENDLEIKISDTLAKSNGVALQTEFVKLLSKRLKNSKNVVINDFLKSNQIAEIDKFDSLTIDKFQNKYLDIFRCDALLFTSAKSYFETIHSRNKVLRFVEFNMTLIGLDNKILWEFSQKFYSPNARLSEESSYFNLSFLAAKKIKSLFKLK